MEKGIDRESKWKTEKRDDVKRKGEARSKSSKIEVFLAVLARLIYLTIMGRRRYSEQEKKDDRPRDRIPY